MLSCLTCGRRSAATDRFCTACGSGLDDATSRATTRARSATPTIQLRSIRSVPCPHCKRSIDRDAPFCQHCGLKVLSASTSMEWCASCGAQRPASEAAFCGQCGSRYAHRATPSAVAAAPRSVATTEERRGARLAVIDANGDVVEFIPRDEKTPKRRGRETPADAVRVAPLSGFGSMFYFTTAAHDLSSGDLLLIGSQVVRFTRLDTTLAAPAPRVRGEPAATPTMRDVVLLEQLRPDGTVRDTMFVQEGRRVLIGRDEGDWVFPYDRTVSARHAEIAPAPPGDGWTLRDLGSRNGTGVAVRTPRLVRAGDRLLVGGQLLRVEYA